MPDVLIRGLTAVAVARIDSDAAAQGLSRNEYLRRRLESGRSADSAGGEFTVDDLRRAAEAAKDLDDPQVMDAAWR